MAAVVLQEGHSLDPKHLFDHAVNHLPDYACPKFVRVMSEMDITTTFKHRKKLLVSQGFDPSAVSDKLYVVNKTKASYVAMTTEIMQSIRDRNYKLWWVRENQH